MTAKELAVREKKELQKKAETTFSYRVYQPDVDIIEKEKEFILYADMCGVGKNDIEVSVENNWLKIRGKVNPKEYENLKPLYVEYNVGHFEREFYLTEQVDQNNIEAKMRDGVLTLRLRKAEKALPRKIKIE